MSPEPAAERIIRTSCAELRVDEHQIIWQHLVGKSMTLEQAEELAEAMMHLGAEVTTEVKRLISYTNEMAELPREVRRYFGQHEPKPGYLFPWKTAMVAKSPVQRVLARVFIKLNPLPENVTARVFADAESAVAWLLEE